MCGGFYLFIMDREQLYNKYEIYHYEVGDIKDQSTISFVPIYEYIDTNFDTHIVIGGGLFGRIFYQNIKYASTWASNVEIRDCQSQYKWSKLYLLDDERYKLFDGKYEFYLRWSDVPGTQHWRQSSSPTSSGISGYEAIDISYTDNSWGGLSLSSTSGSTYIDGSPNAGTWYYAIGNKVSYNGGVPGPNENYTTKAEIELFVRYR